MSRLYVSPLAAALFLLSLAVVAPLLLAGCPAPGVANPTGDCEAPTDGSRLCYHSPEAGDVYLPDCDAPLAHEYWRVFAQSEESAYIVPQPFGSTAAAELCAVGDAGVHDLFDPYGLCDPDAGAPEGGFAVDDALAVTRLLHGQLAFVAVDRGEGTWDVDPFVPMDDVLAICDATSEAALEQWCADQEARVGDDGSCADIGILMDQATAEAVAGEANGYYGISSASGG